MHKNEATNVIFLSDKDNNLIAHDWLQKPELKFWIDYSASGRLLFSTGDFHIVVYV